MVGEEEEAVLFSRIAALRAADGGRERIPLRFRRRPLIGVPASLAVNQRGRWKLEATDRRAVQALSDAGADVSIFPCRPLRQQEDGFEAVWTVLSRCDGLLLPGGAQDVHPGWYRQTMLPLTSTPLWWEDWWKIHLAQLATLLGWPLLGICQGMQYWVVAAGGDLYQDIRRQVKGAARHQARGPLDADAWQFNAMRLIGGAASQLLDAADAAPAVWGACMHHQAICTAPQDLVMTAVEMDGLPAAVERVDGFFGVGVQWHPEQRAIYATQPYARRLFGALVQAARTRLYSRRAEIDALYEDAARYLLFSTSGQSEQPRRLLLAADLSSEQTAASVPAVLAAAQARAWLREQESSAVLLSR